MDTSGKKQVILKLKVKIITEGQVSEIMAIFTEFVGLPSGGVPTGSSTPSPFSGDNKINSVKKISK